MPWICLEGKKKNNIFVHIFMYQIMGKNNLNWKKLPGNLWFGKSIRDLGYGRRDHLLNNKKIFTALKFFIYIPWLTF